jgi:hypothetical protein
MSSACTTATVAPAASPRRSTISIHQGSHTQRRPPLGSEIRACPLSSACLELSPKTPHERREPSQNARPGKKSQVPRDAYSMARSGHPGMPAGCLVWGRSTGRGRTYRVWTRIARYQIHEAGASLGAGGTALVLAKLGMIGHVAVACRPLFRGRQRSVILPSSSQRAVFASQCSIAYRTRSCRRWGDVTLRLQVGDLGHSRPSTKPRDIGCEYFFAGRLRVGRCWCR